MTGHLAVTSFEERWFPWLRVAFELPTPDRGRCAPPIGASIPVHAVRADPRPAADTSHLALFLSALLLATSAGAQQVDRVRALDDDPRKADVQTSSIGDAIQRQPHEPATAGSRRRHLAVMALGFATSIVAHELGHISAALAVGARPTIGFDKMRPVVYSGIDPETILTSSCFSRAPGSSYR